jgi:hypothetical protein
VPGNLFRELAFFASQFPQLHSKWRHLSIFAPEFLGVPDTGLVNRRASGDGANAEKRARNRSHYYPFSCETETLLEDSGRFPFDFDLIRNFEVSDDWISKRTHQVRILKPNSPLPGKHCRAGDSS